MIARIIPEMTAEQVERFWSHVGPATESGCWEWGGAKDKHGYGRVKLFGAHYGAHRVALKIDGREPLQMEVTDHICRNPTCVNPAHLRAVSHRTNMLENSIALPARYATRTHCEKGHELSLTTETPYRRRCMKCRREKQRVADRVRCRRSA